MNDPGFGMHIREAVDIVKDIFQAPRPKQMCAHPEWLTSAKPAPADMVGPCEHNMSCPVCGFGWGCTSDPCIVREEVA
jgi:hypothetical protein